MNMPPPTNYDKNAKELGGELLETCHVQNLDFIKIKKTENDFART